LPASLRQPGTPPFHGGDTGSNPVGQEWILGGKWLAFTYAEKKIAENPMPFTATGYFGYDPEVKMLVVGGVDSTGGYSTGGSKGWMSDVLTFEGPWHIGGMTATARDTFTKNGSNEVSHRSELEYEGNGSSSAGRRVRGSECLTVRSLRDRRTFAPSVDGSISPIYPGAV
jgi:hypothetical protein